MTTEPLRPALEPARGRRRPPPETPVEPTLEDVLVQLDELRTMVDEATAPLPDEAEVPSALVEELRRLDRGRQSDVRRIEKRLDRLDADLLRLATLIERWLDIDAADAAPQPEQSA